MSNIFPADITPYDGFRAPYKVLEIAGIYPVKRSSVVKNILQRIYLYFVFVHLVTFYFRHGYFMYLVSDDWDKFMEAIYMNLPHVMFVVKSLTICFFRTRLDALNELMKGSCFAAKSAKDQKLIVEEVRSLRSHYKTIMFVVLACSNANVVNFIVTRLRNSTDILPAYFPFKTDSWTMFCIALLWEMPGTILWTGFSHLSVDFLIASYLSQARLQLVIIKNNLEHLFDDDSEENRNIFPKIGDEKKKEEKLIEFVERCDKLYWFVDEILNIFQAAIFIQLVTASGEICLVIYSLQDMNLKDGNALFLITLSILVVLQIFMYCYFGTQVEYESRSINDSLYLGNWLSLSPRLRKMVLIAMARWSKPITPTIAQIAPLTLNTFASILQMAYSLHTLLKE